MLRTDGHVCVLIMMTVDVTHADAHVYMCWSW
jgi:hypothetical protein